MWYVIAATDGQIRTYRASRVLDATLLDDRVERPAGFDLAAYWAESSAAYERDVPTVEVTVRIPKDREWRIADVFGSATLAAAERLDETDPEGWQHLRLTLSWPDEVPGKLLSIGSSLEVLHPAEMRDGVAATARRIVERYRDSVPVETGR
jgi:predicted DNA-binding transcriptional regulator YafY